MCLLSQGIKKSIWVIHRHAGIQARYVERDSNFKVRKKNHYFTWAILISKGWKWIFFNITHSNKTKTTPTQQCLWASGSLTGYHYPTNGPVVSPQLEGLQGNLLLANSYGESSRNFPLFLVGGGGGERCASSFCHPSEKGFEGVTWGAWCVFSGVQWTYLVSELWGWLFRLHTAQLQGVPTTQMTMFIICMMVLGDTGRRQALVAGTAAM